MFVYCVLFCFTLSMVLCCDKTHHIYLSLSHSYSILSLYYFGYVVPRPWYYVDDNTYHIYLSISHTYSSLSHKIFSGKKHRKLTLRVLYNAQLKLQLNLLQNLKIEFINLIDLFEGIHLDCQVNNIIFKDFKPFLNFV